MAVLWQSGKKGSRPAVLALLLGALCLTAGCQSTNESRTKTPDPLMGEKAPVMPSIGPTPPPQNRANMTVPPPPTSTASKSITAMVVDPLSGGKAIGIPDPNAPAQTAGWVVKDKQPGGTGSGAGGPTVSIRAPEIQPVPPPTYNPNLPPNPLVTPVPAVSDADPLLTALKTRGMVYQQQDNVPGGVRFRCAVPSPQDPTVLERYEATAADYRSAVLAVLNQIDKSR